MKTIIVKPQKGLMVRDPETRMPLETAGEEKPRNTYWLRRIKDKSVVEMTTKPTPKKETGQ